MADNINICWLSVKAKSLALNRFTSSLVVTLSENNCEPLVLQQESQFLLQDGEIA
jgi:hypothetical protein